MKRGICIGLVIAHMVGIPNPAVSVAQDGKTSPDYESEMIAKAQAALQKKDITQMVSILEQCMNFPLCAYHLGTYYKLKNDFPKAHDLFQKASLAGHHESQMELSLLYAEGKGVTKDMGNAFFWLGTAAKSGYEPAIVYCKRNGIAYGGDDFGLTVENLIFYGYPWTKDRPGDPAKTQLVPEAELSSKAKEALQKGNVLRARYLLAQGVVAGYPSCTYDLGMLRYLLGKYAVSYKLFLRAALSRHGEAQYMLSIMYAEGQGVEADMEKFDFWLGTSAKSGVKHAIKKCNEKKIPYWSDNYGLAKENMNKHGY
jgi:TPR repeat protein